MARYPQEQQDEGGERMDYVLRDTEIYGARSDKGDFGA